MKRRKAVVGIIITCLIIAAITIQATFGGGIGIGILPRDIGVNPNTTIPYTITLYSQDGDWFDVTIIPDTCVNCVFGWENLRKERISVAPNGEKQLSLNVTPTDAGSFQFRVKAISRNNPSTYAIAIAQITSKLPPSPTPTPGPTKKLPKCIGLEPNLPSPQKLMTETETKSITWTACACDPDEDTLQYKFCVHIEGLFGEKCSEWSTDKNWTWLATSSNLGLNNIYVHVRDGKHDISGPYGDCSFGRSYRIKWGDKPFCACLKPNILWPRNAGTTIIWDTCVGDNESAEDTFWYKYFVDGIMVQNWGTKKTYSWTPTAAGIYDIIVEVRDNIHGSPLAKYPTMVDAWDIYRYKIE